MSFVETFFLYLLPKTDVRQYKAILRIWMLHKFSNLCRSEQLEIWLAVRWGHSLTLSRRRNTFFLPRPRSSGCRRGSRSRPNKNRSNSCYERLRRSFLFFLAFLLHARLPGFSEDLTGWLALATIGVFRYPPPAPNTPENCLWSMLHAPSVFL